MSNPALPGVESGASVNSHLVGLVFNKVKGNQENLGIVCLQKTKNCRKLTVT